MPQNAKQRAKKKNVRTFRHWMCDKTRERKWDNFKCGIAAASDRILSSMRNEERGFERKKTEKNIYISCIFAMNFDIY